MKEKRHYPRYPIKLPVHFRLLDADDGPGKKWGRYSTKDVSMGGMCFEANQNLSNDTEISLELHLPKGSFSDYVSQDPMQVKARIAWCGRNRTRPGTYEIGVEFLALLEKEQARIEECIQFFLDEEGWDH